MRGCANCRASSTGICGEHILEISRATRKAPVAASEAENVRERVEFLEKALEQTFNHTGAIFLPAPRPDYAREGEWAEKYEGYEEKVMPFGEDTVEFIGGDERGYPENCPELAKYLRERKAREKATQEGA